MKTFKLGDDHKITVTEVAGGYSVQFYELTAGRWIPLDRPETWSKFSDIAEEYGIE